MWSLPNDQAFREHIESFSAQLGVCRCEASFQKMLVKKNHKDHFERNYENRNTPSIKPHLLTTIINKNEFYGSLEWII